MSKNTGSKPRRTFFNYVESKDEAIENTPSDNRSWLQRRRRVISDNPSLASSVEKHFARFPEDRKVAELPVEVEIHGTVEVCRSALSLYLSNPHFPIDGDSPRECALRAARIHTTHCRELAW